jgi:Choline/Carnitine o-acyltransferase
MQTHTTLALDKKSPHNWLEDNFWMNKAYLECRAPLLINSNWWLAFQNDEGVQGTSDIIGNTGVTTGQIRRAAWLVWRTLEFKDKLSR